jgi:S1-C subfamily serine protease
MRRLVFVAIAAFFLVVILLPTQRRFVATADTEGERLAMFSKPAVVRIVDGAAGQILFQPPGYQGQSYNVSAISLGSGFFISSNGYIATNAHVVSSTHDGEEKAKQALFWQLVQQIAQQLGKDPRSLNHSFINEHSTLQGFKLFHHVVIPDGSSFPFEIKQYGAPTGESNDQGKDVAIIKIEIKNAPILKLGDSEKVKLQDHVTVIGYPGAADTFNSGLLDSKSAFEATINDGKISARKQASSGAPILQTNTAATHGNSGGPVLNDADDVIGLLTFRGDTVNGQEVSGFSFVVPSNTVMEYVKSAGASNEEGPTDRLYREGLESYWGQHYSDAIPKFEEVKRLFPQHSEVDRLLQSSQQAKAEGKDVSSFPLWLVGLVLIVLFFIAIIIIVGVVVFIIARRRSKRKSAAASLPASLQKDRLPATPHAHAPTPAQAPAASHSTPLATPSPLQVASHSPAPTPGPPAPAPPLPHLSPADQAMTLDLSRTIAIGSDTSPINYGSIKFVSGTLSGQQFDVKAEGQYIGRDSSVSQVVIADPRISKRHLWIGVREGRVVITDQGSRNGTFINDPKSQRVTESPLNVGDTVILGESDVARFEYHNS